MINKEHIIHMCHWYSDEVGQFSDIIRYTLDGHITKRQMADEFEGAVSTPGRWAKGTSCPGTHVRRMIVNYICKELCQR